MSAVLDLPGVPAARTPRRRVQAHDDDAQGTPRGYRRHRRLGERACRACLDAWRDHTADRRREHPPDPPPVDDLDVPRILAVVAGGPAGNLTRAERAAAVQCLHAFGYSDAQIGARLHLHPRTVQLERAALGLRPLYAGPRRRRYPPTDAARDGAAPARTEA